MKALRAFLVLLGLAAIAGAIAYPFLDVKTADGRSCGSAWSQARAELTKNNKNLGGVQVTTVSACRNEKRTVLKRSAAAGGAGVLLLVVVAAWPERRWRAPEVPASYR